MTYAIRLNPVALAVPARPPIGQLAACLFALVVLLAALSATARAAVPAPRLDDLGRGELILRDDDRGITIVAPQLDTDVTMAVSGLINRVVVRQRFENVDDGWVEGIYVFPLPENSAVDRLRMQVGDRFIEAVIEEREAARQAYEQAREAGQTASLLEQERPNIFTTSVANIGPGEAVVVEIEYQQVLTYDSGVFSLRFPLVVGPRFTPGAELIASSDPAAAIEAVERAIDAERISSPVLHPSFGPINPVTIDIEIDAGFPLASVTSATHAIATQALDGFRMAIALAEAEVPADRDFELTWSPHVGDAPGAGLFTEPGPDGAYYALLMVMPPDTDAPAIEPPAREATFIIDTSGSMEGTSIVEARAALDLALQRLRPIDRFNVIQFNDEPHALFDGPVEASPAAITVARRYVKALEAEGGTNMLPALKLALRSAVDGDHVRQIVFLTDGAIGNEADLFETIRRDLGERRLFTVGIGSAPNGYFMTKAAEYGRGTYTYIDTVSEVEAEMTALFEKLERPVVTDLAVVWPDGATVESIPSNPPDLYAGEPVILSARLDQLEGHVGISGRRGEDEWILTVPLDAGAGHRGVGALWAREKIDELTDSLFAAADPTAVRADVVAIALEHGLVSEYTSLVAIDVTPRRPGGEPLATSEMPTNLPDGWDFDAVFGGPAAPGQPHDLRLRKANFSGPAPLAPPPAERVEAAAIGDASALFLPQGASPAALQMGIGTLLLILALLVLWRRRTA